jgi:anti-sigma regulatory factor (Ser/Thr protein kinase)
MMPSRPLLSSNPPSLVLDVDHASAAGEARRIVAQIAATIGLDETAASGAAIVVNELTTNLLKHAREGSLHVHGAAGRLDLCAIDRGPGIADISASLRDGFSSVGTAGNGLGAVRRLATQFDLHSVVGKGTVVFARIDSGTTMPAKLDAGAFWRPLAIDDLCGDACAVVEVGDDIVAVVADGLGHGVAASEASRAAIAVAITSDLAPPRMLERMHAALRPTRGAAVAIARIDRAQGKVSFAGIGNIAASIRLGEDSKSLVSISGIVGHQARAFQEFRYDWTPGATLIMHSDGISSRWNFADHSGLSQRHPATIAATLGRDFARDRDDRCMLVVREEAA